VSNRFYITTAIDYVNSRPHLGHAYEKVLADVIARYHRQKGEKVFFLTGVDEHGQKVQQSAQKQNREPQEFCDEMAGYFRELCQKLNISFDDFVRTTEPRHKQVVQKILQDLYNAGEIYEGEYEGYYSTRMEQFLTEKEMVDGKFPAEYGEVNRLKEKVYFFKLSKHIDWLRDYIKSHPDFIFPSFRSKEVLGALENKVGDLCISRPKARLSWGIPLPFDQEHVTYVWFDALINYISVIGYGEPRFNEIWPAVHVIGKDILVPAHAIYWPIMLKACGVELPQQILVHGWWTLNKEKMSKSVGNVVNPMDLITMYGTDSFRYFVLREMAVGHDADFSHDQFHGRYQADLGNELGNLVNRAVSMIRKYHGGTVPGVDAASRQPIDEDLLTKVDQAIADFRKGMDALQIHVALQDLWRGFQRANQFVEENAPWKLAKDPANAKRLETVLTLLAASILKLSCELKPVLPETVEKIYSQLGIQSFSANQDPIETIRGKNVGEPTPLFPRIELTEKANS
jgi:methionyl-tRNA synthetase